MEIETLASRIGLPLMQRNLIGCIIDTAPDDRTPIYLRLTDTNPPFFEELGADLAHAANMLGDGRVHATIKTYITRKGTIWTIVYNIPTDIPFFLIRQQGSFAEVTQANETIGAYTTTEVLHAYVESLRKWQPEGKVYRLFD